MGNDKPFKIVLAIFVILWLLCLFVLFWGFGDAMAGIITVV
jgi:hypothetical protein